MSLSVTISRTPTDLTMPGIGTDVSAGLFVQSVTRPGRTWRRSRVTADWLDGAPQVSAVLDITEVALTVAARAATAADLQALRDDLDDAVSQWSFLLSLTEDGVTRTYSADCADVTWQPYQRGMAAALVATASLTIPVHPIPGA
jgi:hypothetical protein